MGRKRKRPTSDVAVVDGCQKRPKSTAKDHTTFHAATGSTSHPVLSLHYPRVLTLRNYLLSKLPPSSRSRRRQVALLGSTELAVDATVPPDANPEKCSDSRKALADLLDSTLVGIRHELEPDVEDTRHRDFIAHTQSQSKLTGISSLNGANSSQSEVCPHAFDSHQGNFPGNFSRPFIISRLSPFWNKLP